MAGIFYPLVISPKVAALAMSGSSALVAVKALLLKHTWLEDIGRLRATHTAAASRAWCARQRLQHA